MFGWLLQITKLEEVGLRHLRYTLENDGMQADQWKIYPTAVTPWTVIEKWHKEGKYEPYGSKGTDLVEILIKTKTRVFPWIRLNRVVRDIPNQHILGGNMNTSMRQDLLTLFKARGLRCMCIRCREVGLNRPKEDVKKAVLFIREYNSNEGTEYFLSYELPDQSILFGFVRLRISSKSGSVFPILKDAGLVRELHVYGQLVPTWDKEKKHTGEGDASQHFGFGKRLMAKAEEISWARGCKRVAVIAGIGTRNYYRKLGYTLKDTYLVKDKPSSTVGLSFPQSSSSTSSVSSSSISSNSSPSIPSPTPASSVSKQTSHTRALLPVLLKAIHPRLQQLSSLTRLEMLSIFLAVIASLATLLPMLSKSFS
jgi:ELP3 family radical SAM enzyme/protein acetyltransferase